MTVTQLLQSCTSAELTLWQAYFEADAQHQEERREQAKKEAELQQWVNEV